MNHKASFLVVAVLFLGACSEDGSSGGGTPDSGPDAVDPPVLALHNDTAPLSDMSRAAIDIAPAWLRHDLGLALRQQESERADELAALLVDLDDPRLIDEVAFTIAHNSPEVMASEGFFPELLVLNARLIYEHDEDLDYVELVETGEPGVDDDFWTTAVYRYQMKDMVVEKEVDREIYYWFVVHPKLEDEDPWFIDSWSPCGANTLQCPSTPDNGWFWREFLWEEARESCPDEGLCPTLDEWLPGVEYVWNGGPGSNAEGALREIISYMHYSPVEDYRWLVFGAYGERSIQPNRIYGLGRGNCGEWADMTSALARTALIPNVNSTPASWDHTWNGFYDENWIEWEPVNGWVDHKYNAPFSNYSARGDGFIMLQTPDYRDDVFTMEVEVYDVNEVPVAGASVAVYSPWQIGEEMYWSYAGEAPTNENGMASFPLVALEDYAVRIETPIGSMPVEANYITFASEGIAVGETDVQTFNLEVAMPAPMDITEVGYTTDAETDAVLAMSFANLGTRFTTLGQRFGITYTEVGPEPQIEVLLLDAVNLERLEQGEAIEVAWQGGPEDEDIPIPSTEEWFLVLSNHEEISTVATGELQLEMSADDASAWTGSPQLTVPFEILPLGYQVVSITPTE